MKEIIKKITPDKLLNYYRAVRTNMAERNRFIMIALSLLFIFDYLLFCFIAEKNPVDIFPSIPLLRDTEEINVYLPDTDGKSLITETREISIPENSENYVRILLKYIIKGSYYENTSISIPVEIFIRKIWFFNETCVIDLTPSLLEKKDTYIPGSETLFRKSVEKTITENISSVKKIIFLETGIPDRLLWKQ